MMGEPQRFTFADDGLVPNNPGVALRFYHGVLPVGGREPAAEVMALFARHGWGGGWINGIYDFQHYHATAHEVLGIARGSADVQFGGAAGRVLRVSAGDAVLIPAGVGHCLVAAAADLTVVGAYPAGQERYDLKRATVADHRQALSEITRVPLPLRDPVTGAVFDAN